jgi:hypothetical protein
MPAELADGLGVESLRRDDDPMIRNASHPGRRRLAPAGPKGLASANDTDPVIRIGFSAPPGAGRLRRLKHEAF